MKLVVALANLSYFRHFDGVVRRLCDGGHTVVIASNRPRRDADAALQACLTDCPTARYERQIVPTFGGSNMVPGLREVLNYSTFFKRGHPSPICAESWIRWMPRKLRPVARLGPLRRMLVSRPVGWVLRRISTAAPVDHRIVAWLKAERPDALLASPFLLQYAAEVEYVRAAKTLGIPTLVAVASWDNLTTKGTFHTVPDLTLVWNDSLRDEAVAIHSLPTDRVTTTGAAPFDYWFESETLLDREAFCRRVGLDPDRPFVAYVGSCRPVAQNEVPFVTELADSLSQYPELEGVSILMRPHPLNFADWAGFEHAVIRVWPAAAEMPDTSESRNTFRNTLHHAHAVVGLNTSAFLDAACADKPCITILAERYRNVQTDLGHFHHLLNAGFLETARDPGEAAALIARVLRGEDPRAAERSRFVATFVRPHGREHSASEVTVSIIEHAARARLSGSPA